MSRQKPYSINKNKYLLDSEFQRLTEILHNFKIKDTRNCLLIYLAIHTGARAQEILNIEFNDLDAHEQSLLIKGIKGSKDRELPLPSWLFVLLEGYVKLRQASEMAKKTTETNYVTDMRVFNITYNRLLQIWQLYRPVHKKFHSLRHSFAIRLYKKTKDLRLVQVALGHRNITNTMIYADYVYSQQELRKLIL